METEKASDLEPKEESKDVEADYGCPHYKRRVKFVSPCCGRVYYCRICHDENEQTHTFNRQKLEELICENCGTKQRVQTTCEKCGIQFGKYTCLICNLFDDVDRSQYHCDECGICRVGGRDKFFHCLKCDICLPKTLEGTHKCVEKVSHGNCAVCLENIHSSRISW